MPCAVCRDEKKDDKEFGTSLFFVSGSKATLLKNFIENYIGLENTSNSALVYDVDYAIILLK